MKTIEVSDELYDQLIELSNELNTQDNRATASPYVFQIQTNEEIAVPYGCGNEAWYYDDSKIETEEEIKNEIFSFKDWDEDNLSHQKKYATFDSWEQDRMLESIGWRKGNYDYKHFYQNAFLTAKACKEHIRLNHYHYREPVDYLTHCFRNPELEMVLNFLKQLTKN